MSTVLYPREGVCYTPSFWSDSLPGRRFVGIGNDRESELELRLRNPSLTFLLDTDACTSCVNQAQTRINVDFPALVVESLDREAFRQGVTRKSIIKVLLVERIEAKTSATSESSAPEDAARHL